MTAFFRAGFIDFNPTITTGAYDLLFPKRVPMRSCSMPVAVSFTDFFHSSCVSWGINDSILQSDNVVMFLLFRAEKV